MNQDALTRRGFLAGAGALAAATMTKSAWAGIPGAGHTMGEWQDDSFGLPCYEYRGPLRFASSPRRDGAPMIPDDPWFLLGNYRLTLFPHASGQLEILTGERAWGRMNQGAEKDSGANAATIEVDETSTALIGLDAPAAAAAVKRFGVGFAHYEYDVAPGLKLTRTISVAPSGKIHEGTSAFVVQIRMHNTGPKPRTVRYRESIRAKYEQIVAAWDMPHMPVAYLPEPVQQVGGSTAYVAFRAKELEPLALPPAGQMTRFEPEPPALFVRAIGGASLLVDNDGSDPNLGTRAELTLGPGQQHELRYIAGYTRVPSAESIDALCAAVTPADDAAREPGSAFGAAWSRVVPAFRDEPDATLRREMRWNAAVLEQMSTWREYYDETVVPQGTMYDYDWGIMASNRDLAQQALPFCHTNPAIARSTLRFILKRIVPDGEVKLNDQGFGWVQSNAQQTSDQQLYFFLLLAEYLRATGDATVLTEQIAYYPRENSGHDTGLAHVRQAFFYLRDRIGVGQHGIIKRWNSDWNDMFFYWPETTPYNVLFQQAESQMNSAMAIVILGDLATEIERAHAVSGAEIVAAMRAYRTQLLKAWMRDMEGRTFARRCWLDATHALGDKEMWLEPQGFALLIPEFPAERREQLWREIQGRLLKGEVMGPRQIEVPVNQPGTPAGTRENGGFWYALNGPVVLGVAKVDAAAAEDLLRRMTFSNYSRHFPDYWTGQWSASDSLDSSLVPTQGLSTATPWCAHPHAWPLYCYLRLREKAGGRSTA